MKLTKKMRKLGFDLDPSRQPVALVGLDGETVIGYLHPVLKNGDKGWSLDTYRMTEDQVRQFTEMSKSNPGGHFGTIKPLH